jgi:hypothetical protein
VSNFLWLTLTTTALVVVGVALLSYYAERGSFEAPYSTFRADRQGAKAVFLWLERLGYAPQRVTEDFTQLRARGLLFIIAPSSAESSLFEADSNPLAEDALDDWVKKGNIAVLFCDGERQPLSQLNQRLVKAKARPAFSRPAQRHPLTESAQTLAMKSGAYFKSRRASRKLKWASVFETSGRPQVVVAQRGKGVYVLVADAHPVSNVGITEGDNATFLLNLVRLYARDSVVFFDEFHHGHATSGGVVAYAKQRSLHYFLIYLLLAVAVGLWRSGARFGQVIPRWTDPRRESVESARAVATLYQSAGMRRYALETCSSQFRKKLARFVRHVGAWNTDGIAAKFERKAQHHPREIVEICQAVEQALKSDRLTDSETYQLCRRMAEFEKEFIR